MTENRPVNEVSMALGKESTHCLSLTYGSSRAPRTDKTIPDMYAVVFDSSLVVSDRCIVNLSAR